MREAKKKRREISREQAGSAGQATFAYLARLGRRGLQWLYKQNDDETEDHGELPGNCDEKAKDFVSPPSASIRKTRKPRRGDAEQKGERSESPEYKRQPCFKTMFT